MKHSFYSQFFRRTMLSYFCIIMVPVVVFCGILTQRVLMQERQRKIGQEEAIIQGATQLLEEKFQQLNTLGNQLSFSTWLTKTQSFSPLLNNTIDYFRRKEICQELSVYLAGIGIAEDIMVIFPEKDILVTQKFWGQCDDLYYVLSIMQGQENERLLKEVQKVQVSKLLPLSTSQKNETLLFVKRIGEGVHSSAYLLIPVDVRALETLVNTNFGDSLSYFSISDNTITLFQIGQSIDGAVRQASNFAPVYYEIVPDLPQTDVGALFLSIALPVLVSIFIGGLISYILAMMSYRPIHKILVKLGVAASYKYELAEIERVLDGLVLENQFLESKATEGHSAACDNMLRALLTHEASASDREKIETLRMPFCDEQFFQVVLLVYGEAKRFEEKESVQRICSEVVESWLKPIYWTIEELLDGNIVLFLCYKDIPEEGKLDQGFKIIRETIPACKLLKGPMQQGLQGIRRSYLKVQEEAIRSKSLQGIRTRSSNAGYYYPIDQQLTLIRCIRAGDYIAARSILEELHARNMERICTLEESRSGAYIVYETLLRLVQEYHLDTYIVFNEFQELQTIGDIEKEWDYVYDMTERLCSYATQERLSSSQTLTGRSIVDYVEQNYDRSSLSLQDMAEHFGLSASRVSHIFKDSLGIKFIDYVHILRVEKAKELFYSGEKNILTVARKVGYENEKTFKRAFIINENMTPSAYLKELSEKIVREQRNYE